MNLVNDSFEIKIQNFKIQKMICHFQLYQRVIQFAFSIKLVRIDNHLQIFEFSKTRLLFWFGKIKLDQICANKSKIE
jgi:hypothetical protein